MTFALPYPHSASCIGIICNGELESTAALHKRIRNCSPIISVDGGLNHCQTLGVIPQWIVGDFDSVDHNLLETFNQSTVQRLERAKDCTDLEAALEIVKKISKDTPILVFAGMGGRLDHTLTNIFSVIRNPGRVFLESESQIVFAIDESTARIKISGDGYKTGVLFPLNGAAQQVFIENSEGTINYATIEKNVVFFPFKEECFLQIGTGELIVILDKRALSPAEISTISAMKTVIPSDFTIHSPLPHILQLIAYQAEHPHILLTSNQERVFNISPSAGKCNFSCEPGQTISLIPLYGTAKGIKTEGLRWEFGEGLDQLNKAFVGLSNVCLRHTFSVQLTSGKLLCIVNSLIDQEMLNL